MNETGTTKRQVESFIAEFVSKVDLVSTIGRLSDKSKEQFYHDLYVMVDAGSDLSHALDSINSSTKNKRLKQLASGFSVGLIQGKGLSEMMAANGAFNDYEVFNIRIGEESGDLVRPLKELHDYFKARIKMRRAIVSAISYPVFILLITIGVLIFMMSTVVPMFADMFARLDSELPPVTLLVMNVSDLVRAQSWLLPLLLALVVIGILILSKNRNARELWERHSIRIPFVGKFIHIGYLARYTKAMATLLNADVPIMQALDLSSRMTGMVSLDHVSTDLRKKIAAGSPLSVSMKEHAFFEPRLVSLIEVGEEVSKLPEMFSRCSEQYTAELEQGSKVLNTILEPLMILFIALLVGTILVAMYLPLFKISTSIG